MEPDLADAVLDPLRLAAVRDSGLLDSVPEEPFDRLARLAAKVLKTPLAFVTVVDETRSFWKSRIGLEGDAALIRENPVNESFCQYVVRSGTSLVAGDTATNPLTRDNPSIDTMGVAAWAGWPLRAPDGQVLGTFCVVDVVTREWTQDELDVLEALADAATGEIALRESLQRASAFARTLQQSLLPPLLPTVEGLDVAGSFRPARDGFGVLGDFYDVFETQPDRWFIALGDVRGHGPLAAETVASARWSIRAAAARTHHTSAVLESVNRQLVQRPDIEAPHLTAALMAFSTDRLGEELQITLTTAGHPPPLIRGTDGRVESVDPAGRPLGIFDDADLTMTTLGLRRGDALLVFTDGVIEARDDLGRLLGDQGLQDLLADTAPDASAAELTDHVIDAARRHQDGPLRDDVAVVALRFPPT